MLTMFKQIVTDVIGQQLESFIENFDSNSIQFTGFPSSNLRLKNLRIKPDALSALQLPVVLKHGYVGSLHIVIPFVGLHSTPVQVTLEDVFIVAGLVRKFDGQEHVKGMRMKTDQAIIGVNVAEEASRVLELEHARLGGTKSTEKEKAAEEKAVEAATDTWQSQLIASILDNIQINVRHVHVRLEDDFISGLPFCVGITLGRLKVRTCNKEWKQESKNVQRNEEGSVTSTNRRMAEVESLAVYWDSEEPGADWQVGLSDEPSVLAFRDMIEARAVEGHCQSKRHDFVLAPVTVVARMTQRKPKEAVDSRQPELEVTCCTRLEAVLLVHRVTCYAPGGDRLGLSLPGARRGESPLAAARRGPVPRPHQHRVPVLSLRAV